MMSVVPWLWFEAHRIDATTWATSDPRDSSLPFFFPPNNENATLPLFVTAQPPRHVGRLQHAPRISSRVGLNPLVGTHQPGGRTARRRHPPRRRRSCSQSRAHSAARRFARRQRRAARHRRRCPRQLRRRSVHPRGRAVLGLGLGARRGVDRVAARGGARAGVWLRGRQDADGNDPCGESMPHVGGWVCG